LNIPHKSIQTVLLLVTIGLAIYSFVGVMQAVMLSGAPNYSTERAVHNVILWGGILLASLICGVLLVAWRRRSGK